MMSSETMASLPPPPPLSPELCLATMRTVDMFDTSWGSSLGLESPLDSWSPLPSPLPGDSLAFWNVKDGLEDIAAESLEAHLGLEHCGVDVSFLHDTSSNMSNSSSSSSTITSHSIPGSLGDLLEVSSDDPGTWSDLGDFLASCSESDVVVEEERQEAVCDVPQNTEPRTKQHGKTARHIKHTHHTVDEPLTVLSSGSRVTSPVVDKHQASSQPSHQYRMPSRNVLSPRKKKVLTILESNVKWSELSGSEQWMFGEGLNVLLSQTLGVREKLDVLSFIHPSSPGSSPTTFNDLNLASLLDDDKLEGIRRYHNSLKNSDEASSRFQARKAGKRNRQHIKHNSAAKTNRVKSPAKVNHRPSLTKGSNTTVPRSHNHHHTKRQAPSHPPDQLDTHNRGNKKHKQGHKNLPRTSHQATKVYRQLLKEKRSGLFKDEEVVCVSQSSTQSDTTDDKLHRNTGTWPEEDEDIDIMG